MEETNITMYEGTNEEPETTEQSYEVTERSGIGTGLAMLIGSGITLAAIAGGKALKKLWAKRKSKKEQAGEPVEAVVVEETAD